MNTIPMLMNWAATIGRSFRKEKASIDDLIDRLHYQITTAMLFSMCLIVTAIDISGTLIDCQSEFYSPYMINNYCMYHSYTIPQCHKNRYGGDDNQCIYSGVGSGSSDGEKIYHSYYKWASPLIFFQAILFYLPHYFWKNLEGGRVSNIREYMWGDVVDPDIFEDIKTRGSGLATFVVKTMHRSRFLYMNYIFCKFLNVANVVANMMFINYYLEDAFFKYGWGAIKHFQTNLYDGSDPIQEVFPFVTKCDFKIYGPSGTTSFYDAMCLLPWNPLHAKFYIVIWFWLIILLGLSVLNLVYRLADFFLPVLRRFHLRRLQPPSVNNSKTSNSPTQTLAKRLSIGNFYFVYMLGHNMDSLIFSHFLNELSKLLSSNNTNSHERTNEHEMKPIIKIC